MPHEPTRAKSGLARRSYRYDAALSFAGENRKLAEALFQSLTRRGFSVFYDADREAHLWGKTSRVFERIYGPQSRYVIPIVSKHYVRKPWTRFEFETALEEQEKRRGEFILPIRLDDSRLLGLPNDVVRQDARKKSVEELAELFAAKCRRLRRPPLPQHKGIRKIAIGLLQHDARAALGLLATAAVPMPQAYFQKLFPKYNWKQRVKEFERAGVMRSDGELLRLNDATLKALRQDTELQKSLNQRWIDRLSKLDAHVDTAAFLSVHYLAAERFEDAARVAVNIAESANLGWWNKIYVILLEGLARRRSFKRLSPETQVRLLNALGMCLSHVGKHRDALKRFDQLRRLATRHRNAWGVGQSFINAGVAAHQGGDDTSAEQFYEKAVEHGKRSRDPMLRGRALSNLSQLYQNTDVDRAEAMLEESLKAKAAANDSFGFVAGIAVRAGFAVAREQFAVAAKLYQQAAQAAARLGLRYEQAMSTYNQGRALQDLGRMRSAMRLFERARLLAVPDDHTDVLQLALNALAAGAFAAKRYRDVLRFGQELLAVTKRTQNQEYELGSLHMMAVASLGLQRTSEAQHGFRAAIKTARAANRDEWVVRSIVDSIRPATKSAIGNPDRSQLKRIAKTEAANGHRVISSGLWTWVAKLSASAGAKEDASEAYETADTCLPKGSESASERFELYRNRFAWAWQSHRFEEAVRVLDKMERFATQSGIMDEALAAMDQRGVCLQELGRHAEAEPLHRTAARVAKRLGQDQQEENSLNNLGEALRHLGRLQEAISVLKRSEAVARKASRISSAISTAHNRALALEAAGKAKPSKRLLIKCRDDSAHLGLWYEYVRAWEGIANLTWATGGPTRASAIYRRALREARRHHLRDLEPRIALNYARLLRSQGKSAAARRMFSKYRAEFERFIDAHEYFATLANLYADAHQMQDAASTWAIAGARAESVGDDEYSSYCASQQAQALAKVGKHALSQRTLRRALECERDPARRANLLIQLLALLADRKSKNAQATFEEALDLCNGHQLYDQKAELYLVVGDHDIAGKYNNKFNALKAYAMAMMAATQTNVAGSGSIASRILFKLTSADSPVTEDEMHRLLEDARKFLTHEAPNAGRAIRLLLWPMEMAAQLMPYRKQPRRLLLAAKRLLSPSSISRYLSSNVA